MLNSSRRILLATILVVVVAVGATIFLLDRQRPDAESTVAEPAGAGHVVREDSRRLNAVPGSKVQLVEFLDFECEGCRAVSPAIDELRAEYGDRMDFVIRYFPLKSHFNSMRAAKAVEAAAQQGELESMYRKMFDTQRDWGEQQQPADDTFTQFARDLGLDMAAFEAAYNDPATTARIQQDIDDGVALGVEGTPTFFLNGDRLHPKSFDDLKAAIQQALDANPPSGG